MFILLEIWYTIGIMENHEVDEIDEERLEAAEELLKFDVFPKHPIINEVVACGLLGLAAAGNIAGAVVGIAERAITAVTSRSSFKG